MGEAAIAAGLGGAPALVPGFGGLPLLLPPLQLCRTAGLPLLLPLGVQAEKPLAGLEAPLFTISIKKKRTILADQLFGW